MTQTTETGAPATPVPTPEPAAPVAETTVSTAPVVETPPEPIDTETENLLKDISLLTGKPVTAEELGNIFAWAKAHPEEHVRQLVDIADSGSSNSNGAIVLLINRYSTNALNTPVGTKLSDKVIKRALSATAQTPLVAPPVATSTFIEQESAALLAEARKTGEFPAASEVAARLKLNVKVN